MLLFIANHRNTVILAIIQCNNLKPTIQTPSGAEEFYPAKWLLVTLLLTLHQQNVNKNVTLVYFKLKKNDT